MFKFWKIPATICSILKSGKNALLDTISKNIEDEFNNQVNSVEKINKYSQNWKEYYNDRNFEKMDREYKKLENELEKIVPLESTIKEARNIENLHILIKNKGGDFNLSNEEVELAKKLIN